MKLFSFPVLVVNRMEVNLSRSIAAVLNLFL